MNGLSRREGPPGIVGPHMAMLLGNSDACWDAAGSVLTPVSASKKLDVFDSSDDHVMTADFCCCGISGNLSCRYHGNNFVEEEEETGTSVGYDHLGLSSCRFLHSNFPR